MLSGFLFGACLVSLVASMTDREHEDLYCRLWMATAVATAFTYNYEITMKEILGVAGLAVGGMLLVGAAGVAFTEFGTRMTAHYAPIHEQIRRDTFKQSESHIEGTLRDLDNLFVEYQRTDEAHKPALAAVARHRLADVDEATLPPRLRAWADSLFLAN